jgi:hypothetical protein
MQYTDLQAKVAEKGCSLQWIETEFKELYKSTKTIMPIISKCGHETKVQCSNFLYKSTGITCKQCVYKQSSESKKGVIKDYMIQEYHVIKALEKYLQGSFHIAIMVEGCLADFAIKPSITEDNLWLPIQLKTTMKHSHGIYGFTMHNKYTDMTVMLFAIDDQKIWIMNASDINVKNKINIGKLTSTYSKYEVAKNNLSEELNILYKRHKEYLLSLEDLNIPISESSQRANEMNRFKETMFPLLRFSYPEMGGTVYDTIINETYKVQDKLATWYLKKKTNSQEYRETQSCVVNISRNSFKNPSYKLGDNDFYWIHLPERIGAYIFSEGVLFEHGIISNNNAKVCLTLHPYHSEEQMEKSKVKHTWTKDHLYFYEKDSDKIINLFEPNGKKPIIDNYECPIVIK